jgi:hypothetical protein
MSTSKAIILFGLALSLMGLFLFLTVKSAAPFNPELAEKIIDETKSKGYTLSINEARGSLFRSHLPLLTTAPIRETRVTFYDVSAIQPNDTLPKFTMNLIEIVFKEKENALAFENAFNNSSTELRNGSIAYTSLNVAYVCTKQLRFNEILDRAKSNFTIQ